MTSYLSIYPHCYSYVNENNIFVFDPQTHLYEMMYDYPKAKEFANNRIIPLKHSNAESDRFIKQCKLKNLGYIYNTTSEIPPINRSYNIRFVSSLKKLKTALGYNNGLSILNYITTINIQNSNTCIQFSNTHIYEQINYPIYDSHRVSLLPILESNLLLPNLQEIILSGDFDETIVSELIRKYPCCLITVRTNFDKNRIKYIQHILRTYNKVSFHFITKSQEECKEIKKHLNLYDLPISIIFLISSPKEIFNTEDYNCDIQFLPIIENPEEQKELINEMLLTKEEILSINQTIDDLYKKEIFNTHTFGTLTIKSNGDVKATDEFIGNILRKDFLNEFTTWINLESNSWFKTRKLSRHCAHCPFIALCPPITVYERQGFISKACRTSE